MVTALAVQKPSPETLMEVLANGNIGGLSSQAKLAYLTSLCESLNLNPLTRPFQYLQLSGKVTLYATKDATDQLRKLHSISTRITSRDEMRGVWVVTAQATDKAGRVDESIGAVTIEGLKGDALANAIMKAETKAKRRVTLSICGLGILDETEIETIPDARPVSITTDDPPMPQWSGVPPAENSEMARRAFWARATQLGYVTPEGRLSKRAVHAALGVAERDGALKEWMEAENLSWATVQAQLDRITAQRRDAETDAAPLPYEPCPQCGSESDWGNGGCRNCGYPESGEEDVAGEQAELGGMPAARTRPEVAHGTH